MASASGSDYSADFAEETLVSRSAAAVSRSFLTAGSLESHSSGAPAPARRRHAAGLPATASAGSPGSSASSSRPSGRAGHRDLRSASSSRSGRTSQTSPSQRSASRRSAPGRSASLRDSPSHRSASRRSASRGSASRGSASRRSASRRSASHHASAESESDYSETFEQAPSTAVPSRRPSDAHAVGPPALGPAAHGPAPGPRATEVTQLPTRAEHWRAPHALDLGPAAAASLGPAGQPLAAPAPPARLHDAVPRHLKPRAWELASLGQGPPAAAREAWPDEALPPRADGPPRPERPPPAAAGPRALARSAEDHLVDRLARQFVLSQTGAARGHRERAAYREMLEQVAFQALEPQAAAEAARLLSRCRLAPVSCSEVLCAFRRSLHLILSDERVLDILESQMALHFGGAAPPLQGLGGQASASDPEPDYAHGVSVAA